MNFKDQVVKTTKEKATIQKEISDIKNKILVQAEKGEWSLYNAYRLEAVNKISNNSCGSQSVIEVDRNRISTMTDKDRAIADTFVSMGFTLTFSSIGRDKDASFGSSRYHAYFFMSVSWK